MYWLFSFFLEMSSLIKAWLIHITVLFLKGCGISKRGSLRYIQHVSGHCFVLNMYPTMVVPSYDT